MADVSRRCGCRDENGKQYGKACPKMKNPRHGTWGYRLSAGNDPVTGKRRYVTSFKYTSAEAARTARNADEKKLMSKNFKFDRIKVGEYLTKWLDRHEQHGSLKPSTVRMYRRYINNDISPVLGHLQLTTLRKFQVSALVQQLQDDGRGAVTIKRIHATLSSALGDALQEDLIEDNPAAQVRLPKAKKKRVKVWEPEQAGAFLDYIADYENVDSHSRPNGKIGHRLAGLFEVAILTGMRRGELCGLRWQDVDLPGRALHVRVQLVQVGSKVVEVSAKTDAGQDRRVALNDRAVGALIAWQIQQTAERGEWGEAYQDSGRVFTYEDGRQLRPGYPSKLFSTLVTSAGLPMMRFHDMRHLTASLAIKDGTDVAIVSKMLGHSNSQITRDLYGHMFDATAKAAAEGISAMLPARKPRSRSGVLTTVITSP
ncbi:ICEBs1 integrase [Arthrobacter sp. Hiyo4]|nr:ICEBs1 integrase [Arthrobacter sp. Hiyo4]